MWLSGIKWMFLIIGTMIGAGYASGRELWQFFGQESELAIVLFTALFILSTFVILNISFEYKTYHYIPILKMLLGEKLTFLYDGMIVLYLYTTTVIMLAGGGASLAVLGVPFWIGIGIISSMLVLLFIWGNKGMVMMNAVVIPVLIILLVSVLIKFSHVGGQILKLDWHHQANWPSAFTFTALNILPLVAVLGAIGRDMKSKGEVWIASIGSGLTLGIISFLYNHSLTQVTNEIMLYEIPLFALLKSYPYVMTVVMSTLLWFAIYTTAASGVFGLITRFKKMVNMPLWLLALILILTMIPMTMVGFSTLVAVLYPIYGLLNLYFLASVLIFPIMQKGH
ncbi:YkvI family membrane protein [Tuberibacillus sp. Marseille-P3662]|uniref:YkvI family membrane protein n=1 Tax=Tuberibacillus sp. Marseille-P3662 TaxID=1965358 RepID=UPI000A1C7E46|nr:hypothetical protein [Tuberibacillus sp. Marseille-P3662]